MYFNGLESLITNTGWYSGLNSANLMQSTALSGTGFMETLISALEQAGISGVDEYRNYLKSKYNITDAQSSASKGVSSKSSKSRQEVQAGIGGMGNLRGRQSISGSDAFNKERIGIAESTKTIQEESFKRSLQAAEKQQQEILKAYKKNIAEMKSFMQKRI